MQGISDWKNTASWEELVFGLVPTAVGGSAAPTARCGMRPADFEMGREGYITRFAGWGATPSSLLLQRATFCRHGDKAGPLGRRCRFTTPRARLARVPTVLVPVCRLVSWCCEPYGNFWKERSVCSPDGLRALGECGIQSFWERSHGTNQAEPHVSLVQRVAD